MPAAFYNTTKLDSVYGALQIAKEIELQLSTKHPILAKTQSYGLLTIEPSDLSRRNTLTARGTMEVSPGQLIYILVSNFPIAK